MDGVALPRGGHLLREVPVHALMLGVMAGAMLAQAPLASIAGAAVLVAVSVPCAALSRSRSFFRAHVVDLWAMALVLLASLNGHGLPWHAGGHHAMAVQSGWAFAVVVTAWAGARVWLGMRGSGTARRAAVASGGLTALGLAAMAVLCS